MMRWLIAAIVLARFADSSSCSVRDPRKNDSPAKRSKQVDIFVAGVEGSGHHGVVLGLLQPLIKHTLQIESAQEKACIKTGEMPFYEMDRSGQGARCVARGNVGWESFPSKRRIFENERFAMLYESPDCIAGNVPAGRFPGRWNKLKEPDSCYRCGGWRATLEDLYVRLARSDRLSVAAFQRGFPSLKVIFLWRNFIHSVFSHPPWDGGIRGHAMMLAAHAAALADDARNMTNGSFRVLRYEALQNPRSYSEAAEAIVDFLGYAPSMPVREAAALARSRAWRQPSSEHAASAEKASKDHERAAEVDEAFRDRWAIFLRPEHQLVPFVERRRLIRLKSKKKKRDEAAAPANWTTATCLAPKLEPCRRCTPVPVTTTAKGGEGRWCVHTKEQLTRCCHGN